MNLEASLIERLNDEVTVQLMRFEKLQITTKAGKKLKRLKAISILVNITFIVAFIFSFLTKIINHRNQLKHYRTCIKSFREHFGTISVDVDFSENLKYEPQSLHWSHIQVTVHSGIIKNSGKESYHSYLSNDSKHDQVFLHLAIEEMLKESEIKLDMHIIIESDNCSQQYNSAPHFHPLQELADKYHAKIIQVYSVAGHGKGKVDHVGGLAKVAIRHEIGAGSFYSDSEDMVDFLSQKFVEKKDPVYHVKGIDVKQLKIAQADARLKYYHPIKGSNSFQVIAFCLNATVRAAEHLCIYDQSKNDHGTCDLFTDYTQVEQTLKNIKTPRFLLTYVLY